MTIRNPAILITAGPTREYLDKVRFISNGSSGKMGVALAKEMLRRKLTTTIISGPLPTEIKFPEKARVVYVVSADEMYLKAKRFVRNHQIFISAAAVADYKPTEIIIGARRIRLSSSNLPKIKKSSNKDEDIFLKLSPTRDILKAISKGLPRQQKDRMVIVGFALEDKKNLLKDATRKLKSKGCDIIIANEISSMESGKSTGAIISRNGNITPFRNLDKKLLAKKIIDTALTIWRQKNQ